jgi:hypothetical protein
MRHSAHGINPHLVWHGDVGAARVGHHQRTARLPEIAFGIEMENLRAHARIAGALQDTAAAAADRIAQRRIAERELVIAVRVLLRANSLRIRTGNFLRPCSEFKSAIREIFALIRESRSRPLFLGVLPLPTNPIVPTDLELEAGFVHVKPPRARRKSPAELVDGNDRRSGLLQWRGGSCRARRCAELTVDWGPRVRTPIPPPAKTAETLPFSRDTYCSRYCSDGRHDYSNSICFKLVKKIISIVPN